MFTERRFLTVAAIAGAEENNKSDNYNPDAAIVKKTTKAVIHRVFSFLGYLEERMPFCYHIMTKRLMCDKPFEKTAT